ncbi:DNA-binding transcriptional MerR regulator [Clostridium pascui]|uniref:hypothetical protein n=1 Tax=Clostridium pascui TaxID=46609 RepID=UPI00195AA326|nr:hypothetical protein [Clostridium pascui]MBM7869042.1 DNA-binding transcriptional MerR regulator [Clostridium pascui]
MRGRTITYKYKNFKYTDEIKNTLSSAILDSKDNHELEKIYSHYEALNIDRGYKYIIKDLYILMIKKNMSTTDVSKIYDVSIRTIQVWLKELGINQSPKGRSKKTVNKAPKNKLLSRESPLLLSKECVRSKIDDLLIQVLNDYKVIDKDDDIELNYSEELERKIENLMKVITD